MIRGIPFGQWLPDQPDLENPGLTVCKNVLPIAGAYEPFLAPVASAASVSGTAIGAARVIRPDGQQMIAIGTSSDLHTVVGGVSDASGLSLTVTDGAWTFVPFGRMLWAFASGETPHYVPDIATDTEFEPHPGVCPKAATAARVGDFVVVGDLIDIDTTTDPYRVRWSRFNDPAGDWTDDIALQAGAVDMPVQHGKVVAISGGEFGLIMQRYGVSRLEYTGGVTVFSKTEISSGRGCVAPQSVVQVAGVTYFLSDDGFFRTDGSSLSPISSQRVFSWFLSAAKESAIPTVQGAVDWRSRCIIWSFVGAEALSGYTQQIIYSWESDRWSCAEVAVDWVFDTVKDGMTLEQVSAAYPDLDAMALSLDSPEFLARGRSLTAIIGGTICAMSGAALEASLETGEFQAEPGYRACVNGVAILAENSDGNSTAALAGRDTLKGAAIRWTNFEPEGPDGFAHPVIDARYIRAAVKIPAGAVWAKASGIQIEYVRTGRA